MKKITFLLALILSFTILFTATAAAGNSLRLIKAIGRVNIKDIGGSGLYVFSLWDKNKASPVGADGTFVTVISDSRPQKLSVKDGRKMTRALAIALPKDSQRIIFDAKSTAEAILFRDPGLFGTSVEVENLFGIMTDKESFWDLVIFFKKNLPSRSLEELMNDRECTAFLEKCNSEIFGEDTGAIMKSLHEAKDKLQKLFQKK